jgi:DNA-binding Lrp family transcriptional regulator
MSEPISGTEWSPTPANLAQPMASDSRNYLRRELRRRLDESLCADVSPRRRNALLGVIDALAAACDETGTAWIRTRRLGERIGRSPRTVRRLLADLEDLGVLDREAVVYAVNLGAVIAEGAPLNGAPGGRQAASRISLTLTPSATVEEVRETAAGTVSTGTTAGRWRDDAGMPWDDRDDVPTPAYPVMSQTPGVASSAVGSILPIWETIHHAYPKMTPAMIDRTAAILDRRPDGQGVAKALEIIERSRRSDVRNPVGYFVNAVMDEAKEPSALAQSSTSTSTPSRYGPSIPGHLVRATLEEQEAEAVRRFQELTGVVA